MIGDLARSVRFRWFDQPAGRRRAHRRPGRGPRRARRARRGRRTRRPGATDRGAGRHPRADRAVPGRAARARAPRPGADAGGAGPASLPRVRPARPALDRGRSRRRDRPRVVADYTPRRAPDPAGVHDRHRRRAVRPRGRRWRRRSVADVAGRARGPRRRRRPLPALARRARGRRRDQPRSCGRSWPRCRSPTTYDGCPSRCAPAAARPVGYFAFRPDGDGGSRRGRPRPAACTRWSAAG